MNVGRAIRWRGEERNRIDRRGRPRDRRIAAARELPAGPTGRAPVVHRRVERAVVLAVVDNQTSGLIAQNVVFIDGDVRIGSAKSWRKLNAGAQVILDRVALDID